MSEMLLLGAGASVEAGVPGAFEMTGKILEHFRGSPFLKNHSAVITFVTGGLLFKKGIQGDDPLTSGVNVEELFNAVQLLSERNTIEAAPFVGSWHAMVEELDKIAAPAVEINRLSRIIYEGVAKEILHAMPSSAPAFGGRDIDRNLQSTIKKTVEAMAKGRTVSLSSSDSVAKPVGDYVVDITKKWLEKLKRTPGSNYALEQEFKKLADQQPRPGEGRIFEDVGEQMIRALANFVWIEHAQKVSYLKPLLNLASRQKHLCVATLNYDNSVELLAEDNGLKCSTGIEEWSKTSRFELAEEGLLLLKLHGSIDWESKESRTPERPMPHRVISRTTADGLKARGFRPAVIFGHRNKLTAEGPFLDLLRAFRRELSKAEVVTAVGYSFADVHINEYLSQWLNSNPGSRLRIINPRFGENQSEYARLLRMWVKERLEVVAEPAGKGLLQIFGEPEGVKFSVMTEPNATSNPETAIGVGGITGGLS
jgi:hypothetical protein